MQYTYEFQRLSSIPYIREYNESNGLTARDIFDFEGILYDVYRENFDQIKKNLHNLINDY